MDPVKDLKMREVAKLLSALKKDERGSVLTEYGLQAALVAVVVGLALLAYNELGGATANDVVKDITDVKTAASETYRGWSTSESGTIVDKIKEDELPQRILVDYASGVFKHSLGSGGSLVPTLNGDGTITIDASELTQGDCKKIAGSFMKNKDRTDVTVVSVNSSEVTTQTASAVSSACNAADDGNSIAVTFNL